MVCFELALDEGAPGVQGLPAEHVDGAWQSAQDEHGGGDGEDACCEDDFDNELVPKFVRKERV